MRTKKAEHTPAVGAMADHKSGSLDPRPVAEVSEGGTMIKLQVGRVVTDWLPAANYIYTSRRRA